VGLADCGQTGFLTKSLPQLIFRQEHLVGSYAASNNVIRSCLSLSVCLCYMSFSVPQEEGSSADIRLRQSGHQEASHEASQKFQQGQTSSRWPPEHHHLPARADHTASLQGLDARTPAQRLQRNVPEQGGTAWTQLKPSRIPTLRSELIQPSRWDYCNKSMHYGILHHHDFSQREWREENSPSAFCTDRRSRRGICFGLRETFPTVHYHKRGAWHQDR
jgi:hypothetical protein